MAAQYLISHLQEYGLKPAGNESDFRIPVPLTAYQFNNSQTRVRVSSKDSSWVLSPPDFYHPGGAQSAFRNFDGQLLFAGPTPNALSNLESYPDLTDYVVILSPPWSDAEKVKRELANRNVEGVIEVVPNSFYERLRIVRGFTRYALPETLEAPVSQSKLPGIVIGPKAAKALNIYKRIQSPIDTDSAQELSTDVAVNFAIKSSQQTGYNVVAFQPGTTPNQSDSIVAYMAHYDHVGKGQPTDGDHIWNGFIDNSTGVAILLEIARLHAADPPPYPVLFIFTTAEEQGLLGAKWFVNKSPVPLQKIKAIINVDGGAPPPDINKWTIAASEKDNLKRKARKTLENHDWDVEGKAVISDSDHWPFYKAGIPAIFVYPDRQADSRHIHTAKDEWRSDFPFEGLAQYARVVMQISDAL